jgi:hypothetical protein
MISNKLDVKSANLFHGKIFAGTPQLLSKNTNSGI